MYTKPRIFPLDLSGTLFAIEDEKGRTIGTGSREVCEMLLHLMTRHDFNAEPLPSQGKQLSNRASFRAATTN
jgi:20S proteasome alpha/beta subunit